MKCYIHPRLAATIRKKADSLTLAACAMMFVSHLFLKRHDRDEPDRYWPLHSRLSRRVYTTRFYGRMLHLLRSAKAIETYRDGSYQIGKTSIRYRLKEKYAVGVIAVDVVCPRLEDRWEQMMSKASYAAMTGKARRWIINTYRLLEFSAALESRLTAHPFKSPEAATATRHHAEAVLHHRPRFVVCAKTGRIYYSVTSLPKTIRALLEIGGESLVEIDLAASQPTLLATLYPADCPEKDAYLAFVRSGNFYEEIARWAGEGWDRARAKTEFFNQIAYGSYYCAEKYALLPLFRAKFPQLTGIMEKIKMAGNDALPLRMQKLEATIAITGACGECAERNIPVLPVHDSLICRRSDEAIVGEIFKRHWQAQTGIEARIKTV